MRDFFYVNLSHENIGEVCAVDGEKRRTFQTAEFLLCDRKYKTDGADDEKNCRIVKSGYVDRHGRNDGTCAENEYDIEDVGADNVAERKVALPLFRGNDGRYELGKRSADSDDRKTDKRLAHAEVFRDDRCVVYDEIAAEDNADNAENDHFDGHGSGDLESVIIVLIRDFSAFDGFDGTADLPIHIDRKKNEKSDTAPKTDRKFSAREFFESVELGINEFCTERNDDAEDRRDQNGEGDFSSDCGFVGLDGTDQCTRAENDEQIENVGAENVADCDIILSGDRGTDADGSLRQACAESDDRKTDDD